MSETKSEIRAVILVHGYEIDPKDALYVERIESTYLFDARVKTFCCEMTPSYWMTWVSDQVVLTKAGEKLTEAKRDRLYETYEAAPDGDPDIYRHCRDIDSLKSKVVWDRTMDEWLKHEADDENADEEAFRNSVMESALEYARGNSPF